VNVRLYILQRATALIMAPLVLAHLVIIFYATNRGLSAADILGRTRGSIGWGAFYTLFVLAAATHGAIGVRVIAAEWARLRGRPLAARRRRPVGRNRRPARRHRAVELGVGSGGRSGLLGRFPSP